MYEANAQASSSYTAAADAVLSAWQPLLLQQPSIRIAFGHFAECVGIKSTRVHMMVVYESYIDTVSIFVCGVLLTLEIRKPLYASVSEESHRFVRARFPWKTSSDRP
jgi:hypothetical protein